MSLSAISMAQTVVQARDFDVIGDGKIDDGPALRRALRATIEKAPAMLLVPSGKYRLLPEAGHDFCLELDAASGVTIEGEPGENVELIVGDPRAGCLVAMGCTETKLAHVTIDYDPPPFTQGRIVAVDALRGTIDLLIDAGFPTLDLPWFSSASARWGMVFDAQEPHLKVGAPDYFAITAWNPMTAGTWKLRLNGGPTHLAQVAVGDRFVQLARTRSGGTASFRGCTGGGVDGVVIRASNAVAVSLLRCSNMTVEQMRIEPAPGTLRLITTNADGVHCQQNRGGPTIVGCVFSGMADDAINIYTLPNQVSAVRSATVLEVALHCPILPGDVLQVLDPLTGRLRQTATAIAVETSVQTQVVTLDRAVEGVNIDSDPKRCDAIYNQSASGEGFVISGNTMRNHRRHGTLLRSGGGVVENNVYENLGGFGIVIANEPDWPEGPLARNITLRGNHVARVGLSGGYAESLGGGSIQVCATKLGHALAEGYGQRGIYLIDNDIRDAPGAALFIGSAQDVKIEGLNIVADPATPSRRPHAAIEVANATGVILNGVVVNDLRLGTTAAVLFQATVAAGEEGAKIGTIGGQLNSTAISVCDERAKIP